MSMFPARRTSQIAPAITVCLTLALAACGGGGNSEEPTVETQGSSTSAGDRAAALAAAPVGAIALATSNAAGAPRGGSLCAVSADGSVVAFTSPSNGLVAGDTNGIDLFVKNLRSGAVTRVNTQSNGTQMSATPTCNAMTADGRSVVFASISGDGNLAAFENFYSGYSGRSFVRDLRTGVDRLVSSSAANLPSNGNTSGSLISRDGTSVALLSNATNLVSPAPPANLFQVYVKTIAAAAANAF